MPELIRAPQRDVRSRVFDSQRWAGYQPREDDIIIATYSKCGTTWMQRIVSMLVLKSAEPAPIWDLSPWLDMRLFGPVEEVLAQAEALTCRRFFKTHLPYDALPVYRGVKFVHVARDGRDAALSLHNHLANFTATAREMANAVSLSDPKFGDPFPSVPADPADFFAGWLKDGGAQGDEGSSFFAMERSFWAARLSPDVLLVHYNDLKQDLAGEMRRIAGFLEIELAEDLWPSLVEAAGFEAMKRQGGELLPMAGVLWEGGADRFLHKGANGRWRELFREGDLERYDALVAQALPPDLAAWLANGRLGSGDPRAARA